MRSRCPTCDLEFEPESGFYLGAIYFNYGVTALTTTIFYALLSFSGTLSRQAAFTVCLTFACLFPLWFFRFARAMWLAMDQYFDPR